MYWNAGGMRVECAWNARVDQKLKYKLNSEFIQYRCCLYFRESMIWKRTQNIWSTQIWIFENECKHYQTGTNWRDSMWPTTMTRDALSTDDKITKLNSCCQIQIKIIGCSQLLKGLSNDGNCNLNNLSGSWINLILWRNNLSALCHMNQFDSLSKLNSKLK